MAYFRFQVAQWPPSPSLPRSWEWERDAAKREPRRERTWSGKRQLNEYQKAAQRHVYINCLKHSLKQEFYLPSFVFQVLAVSGRASPVKIWESGQLSQYNVEHWNTDNFSKPSMSLLSALKNASHRFFQSKVSWKTGKPSFTPSISK